MDTEAAQLLALFDHNWFHRSILAADRRPPPPPPPKIHLDSDSPPPPIVRFDLVPRRLHRRSFSDEIAPQPESPRDRNPKLQTILSGKEVVEDDEIRAPAAAGGGERRSRAGRRRGSRSRSMSELEFEELKGFMDLGFDFADVEADPRLMSLVPGLQRLRVGAEEATPVVMRTPSDASDGGDEMEVVAARPYLSEAWEAEEWRLLRNWRVPAAGEGVDMKDHLRFWAHTVASAVR